MTPPASWRPNGLPLRAFILGPAACQGCGAIVWFGRSATRIHGERVLGEVRVWRDWGRFSTHRCVPKPISKHGLHTRELRARHRMLAQATAEFENRAAS